MYKHRGLHSDFGYTSCAYCGGWWEGPESPNNSPCLSEAQQIRSTRGHYEYLMEIGDLTRAFEYLNVAADCSPLAFHENGRLKEVYWNEDGSTL